MGVYLSAGIPVDDYATALAWYERLLGSPPSFFPHDTGDAIVVPAGPEFELSNAGGGPLRLVCCLPVGGQGRLADGSTFVPPWAE